MLEYYEDIRTNHLKEYKKTCFRQTSCVIINSLIECTAQVSQFELKQLKRVVAYGSI